MGKKKDERKHLSQTGCVVFDGQMKIKVNGNEYTVATDYGGIALSHADQSKEVIVLIRHHLPYDELDIGFVVRAKEYDADRCFGLKAKLSDRHWGVYDYCDVVAWGYVDGGLNNPNHFNSCQLRPDDYPQFACNVPVEPDEIWEDDDDNFPSIDRKGVVLRFDSKEEGAVHYNAVVGADEEMERGGTKLMHDCAKVFTDFRKEHPEVTEMHFYTDDEVEVE